MTFNPKMPLPFWLSFPKGIHLRDSFTVVKVGFYIAAALLLFSRLPAQTPPKRKLFISAEDGLTFSYPATWQLNADDDAATAKLRVADLAAPHAVVQLEGNFTGEGPYKDTDFDAGAFAYTLVPAETEGACFTVLDRLSTKPATPMVLDRRSAHETRFTATVAGTEDIHHAVAVFHQNRCILLETVLIRRSADTVAHPLSTARWRQLENAFDATLRSVHLSGQTNATDRSPSAR